MAPAVPLFLLKYRCPAPNCISEFFEMKFTRLEFVGNNKFNVAYMRHTELWQEIFQDFSLDECFEAMRDIELLHPWSGKVRKTKMEKRNFIGKTIDVSKIGMLAFACYFEKTFPCPVIEIDLNDFNHKVITDEANFDSYSLRVELAGVHPETAVLYLLAQS